MYALIVKMTVLKEYDYVVEKFLWLKEQIVLENGSVYFDLIVSNEEENKLEIYEVWETKTKWEAHSTSPHMTAFHDLINNKYIEISVSDYTVLGRGEENE